jgi:peptide/nickel transport system permease protein
MMAKSFERALLFTFLAAAGLFLLVPGFFAPYDYAAQNRELPFAPPTRIHMVDSEGRFHARPFVYGWKESATGDGSYEVDQSRRYPLRFFRAGPSQTLAGSWPSRLHLFGVDTPGRIFLFGTDDFGRDQFSRVLYGGRISLLAGILGAAIALFTGVPLGIISGYYGKWTDIVVMRLVELFLALPWLYLLFAVRATLPLRVKTTDAFLLLVAVVGLVGWARPARLIRGMVLSTKERTFVLAARAMGASNGHILRQHILPETYRLIITMAALLVPQFILAEITLSFFGLGVAEPIPSWGTLLAELQKYSSLTSHWWIYLPGICLVALFLAFQWASNRLQEKTGMVSA